MSVSLPSLLPSLPPPPHLSLSVFLLCVRKLLCPLQRLIHLTVDNSPSSGHSLLEALGPKRRPDQRAHSKAVEGVAGGVEGALGGVLGVEKKGKQNRQIAQARRWGRRGAASPGCEAAEQSLSKTAYYANLISMLSFF